MANNINIISGLNIPTQIPLNPKQNIKNIAALKNLGQASNLAYTYEKGLIVYTQDEGKRFEWKLVDTGKENTGLLDNDFVYPADLIVNNVDYSNKKYNFFEVKDYSDPISLSAGTNITLSGTGTISDPFVINSSGGGVFTKQNEGFKPTVRDEVNYGILGTFAYDFSNALKGAANDTRGQVGQRGVISTEKYGAAGQLSLAKGFNIVAGGIGDVVFGMYNHSDTQSQFSLIQGKNNYNNSPFSLISGSFNNVPNTALGHKTVHGVNNNVLGAAGLTSGTALINKSFGTTVVGQANTDYTNTESSYNNSTAPLFIVGNGDISVPTNAEWIATSRSDAFKVFKNGITTLPSITNALIKNEVSGKVIVTRQYLEESINEIPLNKSFLQAGDNINIIGDGSQATPYVISSNTDDIFQYTDQLARDAVGGILTDSPQIKFLYDDDIPSITADIIDSSITESKLSGDINISKFNNDSGFVDSSTLDVRDIANRDRANHTGTQTVATISDFVPQVKALTVQDQLNDGIANIAPSQNIVFNALINKVDKVPGKSLISDSEIQRLTTLFNYVHPVNHPPSIITQDSLNRFVSDAEKATWNGKQNALGFTPENAANKNIANGYAGLDSNGKLLTTLLPSITISDTFIVSSQSAMLSLIAETGDIAIRTDLNKSYILKGGNSNVLGDWQELLTPTSEVTTVFGRKGAIISQVGDYNADQITETSTRKFQTETQSINNDATSSIQTQLNSKAIDTNVLHKTGNETKTGRLILQAIDGATYNQLEVSASSTMGSAIKIGSNSLAANVIDVYYSGIGDGISFNDGSSDEKKYFNAKNFGESKASITNLGKITGTSHVKSGAPATNLLLAGGGDIAQSDITVADATTTVKGKIKLAGDLGGTADLPTTPTALHKTGNETKTGGLNLYQTLATDTYNVLNIANSGANAGNALNISGNSNISDAVFIKAQTTKAALNLNRAGSEEGLNLIVTNGETTNASITNLGTITGTSIVKSGATTTNLLLAGGGDVSQSSFLKTTGDQFGINGRKSFNEQITFGKVVVTTTGTDTGVQINPSNTSTGLLINNSGTGYGYKGNSLVGDNMLLESSINGKSNYIANINSGGTGFNFVGQNDGANTYTVNKTGDVVAKSVTLTGQTKASSVLSGEYRYNSDLSVANSRAWKTKNDYPVAGSWALQVASDSNETSFDDVITSDRSGIVSVKSNFNVFNPTSSVLAVTSFKLKNNDGSSFGEGASFFQTNNFGYLKIQPNQTNIYGYKSGGVRVVSGLSDINFATGNADLDNSDTRMTIKSTGSVLINTSTDIASSKLTVSSTSQGVLIPRMTTAQKNAIVSPAEGLQVYDLTLHALCFYNGTVWKTVMTL